MKIAAFALLLIFLTSVSAQTEELSPGITPDSPFYFLDRMFDVFQSSESLADERAAELASVIKENKVKYLEKAQERYEKAVEKRNRDAEKDQETAEQVAEQTTKHLLVLAEVYENAPEAAHAGLERAMEASAQGRERALEAISNTDNVLSRGIELRTEMEIMNKVKEEVRERLTVFQSMAEKAERHTYALEKNIECDLFPESMTIPLDVSAYSDKESFTPQEVIDLVKVIMAHADQIEDEEEAKNVAQLAKDIADKVSNEYGRGKGYWEENAVCPDEENDQDDKDDMSEFCEKTADCACGVHITTGECFVGNADFVDETEQCPDFCTGITGNKVVICKENECELEDQEDAVDLDDDYNNLDEVECMADDEHDDGCAKGGPTQYGECGDDVCDQGENTPSYPYYCPEDCEGVECINNGECEQGEMCQENKCWPNPNAYGTTN
ncbi:MAG: hypothetical protein ABIH34_01635 [Nanoarchaeota archaeon]